MWNLKKESKSVYISTQIVEENALFSGKMYTVNKYFPHDRRPLQISLLRKCSEIGRIKKQYGVPWNALLLSMFYQAPTAGS